jgi:hypothetical protein
MLSNAPYFKHCFVMYLSQNSAAVEPAEGPAGERSPAPAMEQAVAAEPARMELSVSAAESAAVALAAEPAAAVGLVSETLPVLASEPVEKSAAGLLAVEPAVASAVEPTAAIAAMSAVEPTAAGKGGPVLANGPVAATKECWVINAGISPKVIVRRIRKGSAAAAEATTSWELQAGEPLPGLGPILAAGRAAAEIKTPPFAATPRLAVLAVAAQGKRKASTGVAEGSQKRKKSSPVKIKDLH